MRLLDEEQKEPFTAADYCSSLRQLPQLREARLNTLCPVDSWERVLPYMAHLTALDMHDPGMMQEPDDDAGLRRVLERLPSLRRLGVSEHVPAEALDF